MLFDDEDGEVFEDATEFLKHVLDHLQKGEFSIDDVVDAVANMMGIKDNNTHDIIREVRFGLVMLGEKELADKIGSAWLHSMPWGLGLRLGMEEGTPELTPEQNEKLAQVMASVLTLGGIDATANGSRVHIEHGKHTSDMDISDLVSKFRQEMDQELGPDAPTIGDGWDRWGL
jgi:hypothetical protein